MTRPWKVLVSWKLGDGALTRSYASGKAAFDAASLLRTVAPEVRVKNVETGEIWTWEDAVSPTPAN